MSEYRHEYIVIHRSEEKADVVEVGQYLYTKKYEGKERTWEFVNINTMEPAGSITGLHRRKITREQLIAEHEAGW